MDNNNSQGFFRKEAVDYSKMRLDGSLVVIQEPKYKILFLALSLFIFTLTAFIVNASFNRFETVQGSVINSSSVLKVYPSKNALLKSIFVKEGDEVRMGDTLAIFRPNSIQLEGESNRELEKVEIQSQIQNLNTQLQVIRKDNGIQREILLTELDRLDKKLLGLQEKLTIQGQQLSVNQLIWEKQLSLLKEKTITESDIAISEKNYLNSKLLYQDLQNEITETESILLKTKNELASLPNELLSKILPIENEMSGLKRQLLNIENDIEFAVYASHNGIISNILNKQGEYVSEKYPILTILPVDSKFVLELYVPSRAIGFLKNDMNVRARFQAFPVQIYGDLKAKIFEVSDTMLFPSEWSNPRSVEQPVYRVRAELEKQFFKADNEKVSLREGLAVEADIILEERTIAEVFFEPIIRQIKTI